MDPGSVSVDADTPDQGQHRRFGTLSSAKPKRSMYEMPTLPTPGYSRPPLRTGTQPVTDWFMYELPALPTPVHSYSRPPPRTGTQPATDFCSPQQANLVDTVAQLQFEIEALKFGPPGPSTWPRGPMPAQPRPAAQPQTGLGPRKYLCLVGRQVGTNIDRYLKLLFVRMGGTRVRSPYSSCPTWRG